MRILPLVVIDLKDPTEEAADLWAAIDQLRRYMRGAPDLFVANMMLVASDGLLTRVGSITSGRQRFMPWRPATGGKPTLEALIRGLFEPAMANPTIVMVTDRNERGEAVKKVQDEAVPAMNGAFEKLRAFFHDFDYERALNAAPMSVLKVYADTANYVYEQDDGWKRFRMMVKELSMAFALVVPRPEAEAITRYSDLHRPPGCATSHPPSKAIAGPLAAK